jgi:hypothetical protein
MEKLSGLVLDIYDDPAGTVLSSIFPTAESLPELVKKASKLQLDKLPDDLFALVLHDGDVTLRKYACADSGNTALSVEYFMKTGYKLPVEAQKVAAANLVKACGWYGIEPPEALEKVAMGAMSMLNAALVGPGAIKQTKQNLSTVRGAGSEIITPEQRKMMQSGGI